MRQPDPSNMQIYCRETARCFIIARTKRGLVVPDELISLANNEYCQTDFTDELREFIGRMDADTLDAVVYNGRDRDGRRLADWWDDYQERERQRNEAEKQKLICSAMEKLTREEKIALGLLKIGG